MQAHWYRQQDMHRRVFSPSSIASWCTGTAFGTHKYRFMVHTILRGEGPVPANWRQQQDMQRHAFQSSSIASWCSGPAFYACIVVWYTCIVLMRRGIIAVARQQDMHRHVYQSSSVTRWRVGPAVGTLCIVSFYSCIASTGRGVTAGALAPATGHAPARIPTIVDH